MNSPLVSKQPWAPGKQKECSLGPQVQAASFYLSCQRLVGCAGRQVGPLSDGSGQRAFASAVSSSPLSFSHAPPLLKAQEITMC